MCIIVYRPAGAKATVSRSTLQHLARQHPDGFGLMWKDRGSLRIWRGGPGTQKDWINRFLALQKFDVPLAAHGRQATHGAVNKTMSHPYWIARGESALMHNGILPVPHWNEQKHWSDTKAFVELVIKPLPENWDTQPHLRYLVRHAAFGSKLVVFFRNRATAIVNESSGKWDDGIWYSNESYSARVSVYSGGSRIGDYPGAATHAAFADGEDSEENYSAWWQQNRAATEEYNKKYPKTSPFTAPLTGLVDGNGVLLEVEKEEGSVKVVRFEGVLLCEACADKELNPRERHESQPAGTGVCELCLAGSGSDVVDDAEILVEVD